MVFSTAGAMPQEDELIALLPGLLGIWPAFSPVGVGVHRGAQRLIASPSKITGMTSLR